MSNRLIKATVTAMTIVVAGAFILRFADSLVGSSSLTYGSAPIIGGDTWPPVPLNPDRQK